MINFTRAFESAWERMLIILFRPFDLGKWFAIGLSAFLAGLIQGGNGFNSSVNPSNDYKNLLHPGGVKIQISGADIHHAVAKYLTPFADIGTGLFAMFFVMGLLLGAIIVLLITWLGAHGQFMLVDNVARNRGSVVWPWRAYSRQANSFFLLYLLFVVLAFVVILPILGLVIYMCVPLYQQNRWPVGMEIGGFVLLGLLYFVFGVGLTIFLFLFREFGVPIMFRQGLTARPALAAAMKVVARNPGSVAIFILLRIAIFLAVTVIAVIVCCATCCVGALPYIGTIFLLPVLIYVKCFTLDCLAQFGPEFDVWTVDVPPPSTIPPLSPPPPL